METFYTINEVALMTGLTSRTIRNYIRMGLLHGEKVCGVWRFPPDAVARFLDHPSVSPSIQAKRNAIVLDFMADQKKKTSQMCVILDLPEEEAQAVADFFTRQYNTGSYGHDLRFAFQSTEAYVRVILKGQTGDVERLLGLFHQELEGGGGYEI